MWIRVRVNATGPTDGSRVIGGGLIAFHDDGERHPVLLPFTGPQARLVTPGLVRGLDRLADDCSHWTRVGEPVRWPGCVWLETMTGSTPTVLAFDPDTNVVRWPDGLRSDGRRMRMLNAVLALLTDSLERMMIPS